jgi:adenosylcobinamide-GDP ribazoletransferase
VERIGRPALFYPVVGLLIGIGLAVLDWILRPALSQQLTSVVLVAALAVVSAGRHLDGLANTADGLIGFRGREWALTVMRDRRLGTFGAAAVFFLLILKVRGFDVLSEEERTLALMLAPMLGRWAMVVLAHGSREAGPPEHATRFAPAVGSREFAVASVFAFLVALAFAEASGLIVLIVVASLTMGLRLYFHYRLGGITDQSLGAVAETAETLALVVFALGSPD